ncbi:MAG: FxsA family protein [Methylocapsa sp.]|nr:FxsA family protein [Methylocapsa sp.]
MLRLRSPDRIGHRPFARLPFLVITYFALWLGAELLAFGAVVHAIGFTGAVALCILTSMAGVAIMRRVGTSAIVRLRQAASRSAERNSLSKDRLVDGTLEGLGAVLLILPGFVSDFLGFALAAPSFRLWIIERLNLGRIGPRRGPALIDLTPKEWSRSGGDQPDRAH